MHQAWLFLVWLLLQRRVIADTPASEIGDAFVTAFPMALEEVGGDTERERRDRLGTVVSLRGVSRFAAFFGLVETRLGEAERRYERPVLLKPTTLLRDAVCSGPGAPPAR